MSFQRISVCGRTSSFAMASLTAVMLAAALTGCGGSNESADASASADTNIGIVQSDLVTTTTSGTAYASKCASNSVPLPPAWGTSTIRQPGDTTPNIWIDKGHYDDSFFKPIPSDPSSTAGAGHVYVSTSTSPPGICVLNAHDDAEFDVICQGTNGKACFWEDQDRSPDPSATLLYIGDKNIAPPQNLDSGGLLANGHAACTNCHEGENIFLTHYGVANHPLNLNGTPGWMPTSFMNPIAPSDFPSPGAGSKGYPTSCTSTCHKQGGVGGRFPLLESNGIRSYCGILQNVLNRASSEGGMPFGNDCTDGVDCAAQSDPEVRSLLALCGGPNPKYPPTLSGLAAPSGIGLEFLSGRRHQSPSAKGAHTHSFTGATETMPAAGCCRHQNSHPALKSADKIETQIYIPADDKPQEVMISVFNGTTWYRAYWGSDKITNLGPRKSKGSLPSTSKWVTLSFTPADVGMTGSNVLSGIAFSLYDGTAWWTDTLFRSSDSPYSGNYVSQMWLGETVPAGAQLTADAGDAWDFQPEMSTPVPPTTIVSDLAFGGSPFESTNPFGAGPERGNDGNVDGNWFNGSVFHTGTGYDSSDIIAPGGEFWFVDLHGIHTVRRVVIHNRTDCCQDRLSHFRINYWDPNANVWKVLSDQSNFIADAGNPVMGFEVPQTSTGFVMIQKTDSNYLHLGEVEVYGDR